MYSVPDQLDHHLSFRSRGKTCRHCAGSTVMHRSHTVEQVSGTERVHAPSVRSNVSQSGWTHRCVRYSRRHRDAPAMRQVRPKCAVSGAIVIERMCPRPASSSDSSRAGSPVENAVGILGATTGVPTGMDLPGEFRPAYPSSTSPARSSMRPAQDLRAARRRASRSPEVVAVRPVVIGSHGGSELVCLGGNRIRRRAVAVNVHQPRE